MSLDHSSLSCKLCRDLLLFSYSESAELDSCRPFSFVFGFLVHAKTSSIIDGVCQGKEPVLTGPFHSHEILDPEESIT